MLRFLLLLLLLTHASAVSVRNVTVTTSEGKDIELNDFHGRILLIDLTASWCGPCEAQIDEMRVVYGTYSPNVTFLTISISPISDTPEVMANLKNSTGANWTFAVDTSLELVKEVNPSVLPTLLITDRQGKISRMYEGLTNASAIDEGLEEALAVDHVMPILLKVSAIIVPALLIVLRTLMWRKHRDRGSSIQTKS